MRQAYNNLTRGRKAHVTCIIPELDTDLLKVTINMGLDIRINEETQERFTLPVVGEVQLRFGFPTSK